VGRAGVDNRRFSHLPGGRRKQVASRRVGDSRTTQNTPKSYLPSYPSSNMKTTDEYNAAVASAIAFKHDHPNEKATTAARIHHVNPYSSSIKPAEGANT
jgi:hypothetical protein